jgi:hypothetical protein
MGTRLLDLELMQEIKSATSPGACKKGDSDVVELLLIKVVYHTIGRCGVKWQSQRDRKIGHINEVWKRRKIEANAFAYCCKSRKGRYDCAGAEIEETIASRPWSSSVL